MLSAGIQLRFQLHQVSDWITFNPTQTEEMCVVSEISKERKIYSLPVPMCKEVFFFPIANFNRFQMPTVSETLISSACFHAFSTFCDLTLH